MMRRLRRRAGGDRGAELIELAIVLPILLVVFAAIVDFGFLFQRYEVLTNAAREGARVGVLPGYCAADVQSRVNDYLNTSGVDATQATVTVNGVCGSATSPVTVTVTGTTHQIDVVQVLVQYPSQFNVLGPIVGLVGGAGWTSLNLRAGSEMRLEPGAGAGS